MGGQTGPHSDYSLHLWAVQLANSMGDTSRYLWMPDKEEIFVCVFFLQTTHFCHRMSIKNAFLSVFAQFSPQDLNQFFSLVQTISIPT